MGVPVKVMVALCPEQTVVLAATVAVGIGRILMVTVEAAAGQAFPETVYVNTYGLPATVIVETFTVPRFPFDVGSGPVQTPAAEGLPPSKLKRLIGGVEETWAAQMF